MANLNPIKGHEQSGIRPGIVIQNNDLNKNLNTVIIAPITSNTSGKGFFTTFFLEKNISGLKIDSLILLFQMRTIDKTRLIKRVSSVSMMQFRKIKEQLSFVF